MTELRLREPDDDLIPLLRRASNEQLAPLVEYVTKTTRGRGRFTEYLTTTKAYGAHYPNHSAYVDEIAAEIQTFGGNSIANIFRGSGVPYRKIVGNVAKRVKANFHASADVGTIEQQVLLTLLEKAYEKMSEDERRELLRGLGVEGASGLPAALPIMAIQASIRVAGFAAYRLAVIVANAVARALLGRGLSVAANAALTRAIGVVAGTIGWALTALWTAIDVARPAYRVVIPCVVQVALIRQMSLVRLCSEGHENGPTAQFCATCGVQFGNA